MGNEQEPTPAELALPRARPVVGRSGVARIWSLPLPVLVSLIVATCLAKYGVGRFVSWKYMYALAVHWRDPFSSSLFKPSTSYLLSSPTSALVSGLTGLSTRREFFALHFGLSLAAIALPVAMPSVRRDRYLRAIIGLVVVGGALPAVLLSWVGSYDPISGGGHRGRTGRLTDNWGHRLGALWIQQLSRGDPRVWRVRSRQPLFRRTCSPPQPCGLRCWALRGHSRNLCA